MQIRSAAPARARPAGGERSAPDGPDAPGVPSRTLVREAAAALAAVALAALSGCALTASPLGPSGDANAPTGAPRDAAGPIVEDLVGALVQLRPPRVTTVQVGPHEADASHDLVVDALVDAGYGIQRVAADQGANLLGWTLGPAPAPVPAPVGPAPVAALATAGDAPAVEDGRLRARLSVGALALERDYRAGAAPGRFVAASALEVGGTRAAVALDDAARLPGTPPEHSRVVFGAAAPDLGTVPVISLVTEDVVRGVTARATRSRGRSVATRSAVNSNRVEVANLFFGRSAFDALRADREPVARDVVLFGDDSLRLGPDGKRQIARFVEDYRPDTDLIGLVGCSNGPTKLAIGNEGLALGRSARVTDELVALGVERSRILDEGCWAGRSAKGRFPSRGVVIELLRASE